jgi:enoyl-CoA hydratase
MTEPILQVERSGGIATLTLNRPKSLNALSVALMRAVAGAFRDLQRDSDVRVAILTGAGRAFCAGLDLKELAGAGGIAGLDLTGEDDMEAAVVAFDRPILCAVNGAAVTGGLELVLMCDMVIASSEARFADTHARVGVTPSWGMSQRLPRLIGANRAREMSYTARFVDATEAATWGLVNRVVAPDALMPTCLALAQDIVRSDPTTMRHYKRLYDEGGRLPLGEALRFERTVHQLTVRHATAEHMAERARALLGD